MNLLRQFSQEFAPWAREATARKIRSAPKGDRKEILASFQQECAERKSGFERSLPERKLSNIPTHFFLHTVALETTGRANTMMNNEVLGDISTDESLQRVLDGNLTLSCSTLPKNGPKPRTERRFCLRNDNTTQWYSQGRTKREGAATMYPVGVLFKEGTILAAYRNDAGTLLEKSKPHRKSKYDKETKEWAFQRDIQKAIKHSLEPHTRFMEYEANAGQRIGQDFNELVIAKTEPSALFFNMDDPWSVARENPGDRQFGHGVIKLIEEVENIASKYPNLPMLVQHHGQTTEFSRSQTGVGLISPDGTTLKEITEQLLHEQENTTTTLENSTFEALQAHMWASGEMTGPDEVEYLKTIRSVEDNLLSRDTNGKTALHTAAETGRTRHLPKELLSRYADLKTNTGETLKQTLEKHKRPLAANIADEAQLRSVKLTPLKRGPYPMEDPDGNQVWAVGTTPGGGILCTNGRGSSTTCGLNWHLGPSMLKYLFLKTEEKGKSTKALELIANACVEPSPVFSPNWIHQHKLTKAMEGFTQTPSPKTNPELAPITAMASVAQVEPKTPALIQTAQTILKQPSCLEDGIKKIQETTSEIQKIWKKLFKPKSLEPTELAL